MNIAKSLMDSAKSVFLRALECTSPEELAAYLDRTCAGDEELRERVDELLQAHKQAGRFLGGASLGDAGLDIKSDQPIAERPGSVIRPHDRKVCRREQGLGVRALRRRTPDIQHRFH